MAFWRRKKDEFVSLGLNRAMAEPPPPLVAETTPDARPTQEPATKPVPVAPPAAETTSPATRSAWQTSVLGLDLSIEQLQAQEAALEQEFSARFRRAVAATRESLSDRLDTLFAGRKQIDEELLDQLEEVLISADIGVQTTLEILETVRRGIARKQINDLDALKAAIKAELLNILQA